MSDKKHIYEIVEKDEANSLNDTLVKRNVDVEFTMQQMLDHEKSADKMMLEYIGKLDIEDAKMKNVVENHEDAINLVKELDPVKQEAIKIWLLSKSIVDQLGPKRDELQKAIDEHKAEIKNIKEQTGWEPPKMEDLEANTTDDEKHETESAGETGEGDKS